MERSGLLASFSFGYHLKELMQIMVRRVSQKYGLYPEQMKPSDISLCTHPLLQHFFYSFAYIYTYICYLMIFVDEIEHPAVWLTTFLWLSFLRQRPLRPLQSLQVNMATTIIKNNVNQKSPVVCLRYCGEMREKKEIRDSRETEETRRREEEEKSRQQVELQLEEALSTMRSIRLLVRWGLNWIGCLMRWSLHWIGWLNSEECFVVQFSWDNNPKMFGKYRWIWYDCDINCIDFIILKVWEWSHLCAPRCDRRSVIDTWIEGCFQGASMKGCRCWGKPLTNQFSVFQPISLLHNLPKVWLEMIYTLNS